MASLQAMATPTVQGRCATARPREIAGARARARATSCCSRPGSRVPADGRLVEAHALRVEESALTGESVPVDKQVEPVAADAPLAERDVDGLLGHERDRRPRHAAGHRDRHGDRARPCRRPAAGRRPGRDAAAAAPRRARQAPRAGGRRDRRRRVRARPAARRGARHAAAHGGEPRGRGDPREPAGGGDDHPRARRAADAAPSTR